jgi:tetratricopeptide (TPR) repeat protein
LLKSMTRKKLLLLVPCAILVAVVGHWGYGYYLKHSARSLRQEAWELKDAGKPREAARRLSRYLRLEPNDMEARVLYGSLLKQVAKTQTERTNALLVLEQVLRRDGSNSKIRRLTAELAFALGRYSDAEWHLNYLHDENPADVEVMRRLAWCEAGNGHPEKAGVWYSKALEQDPGRIDIYREYASLLRKQQHNPEEATRQIEHMVQVNERSVPARLAAGRYYEELRHGAEAERHMEEAERHVRFALRDLKADTPDTFLLAADLALARHRQDQARAYLEAGLRRSPGEGRLSQELARLELSEGHREQARRHLEASLKDLPEQPDELWRLGNLLLDAGDAGSLPPLLAQLDKAGAASVADCLRARLQMQKEDWGAARQTLEKVRSRGSLTPDGTKLVNYLLAECYGHLANPDQQVRAYRWALEADPTWLPARRGMIAALQALGKLDLAIAECHILASSEVPEERSEGRLELARLLLRRNQARALTARRWAEVDQVLVGLQEEHPSGPEVTLLRAEVLAARGKLDEARQRAQQERDRAPDRPGPWQLLVGLAEQQAGDEAALRLVDEAERHTGPRVEWQLARAYHWARAGGAGAAPALRGLEASLPRFPEADQDRLRSGLGQAYAASGDVASAERLWRRVAERQTQNLRVRLLLFEGALRTGSEPDVGHWLDEIRRVEGEGGPVAAYGTAAYQVFQARRDGTPVPEEAHRLLGEAASLRPSWSRVPLLEAEISDLEGKKQKASEKFQEALALDRSQPPPRGLAPEVVLGQGATPHAGPFPGRQPGPELALLDASRLVADLAPAVDEADGDSLSGRVRWENPARGQSLSAGDWKAFRIGGRSRGGSRGQIKIMDDDEEADDPEMTIQLPPAEFDWGLLVRVILLLGVAVWLAKGITDQRRG